MYDAGVSVRPLNSLASTVKRRFSTRNESFAAEFFDYGLVADFAAGAVKCEMLHFAKIKMCYSI